MENIVKQKIGIITDSASDLTSELYREKNIEVIPYYVNLDGIEYNSSKDITVKELFEYSDAHKTLPKTSQITPVRFEQEFNKYLSKYEDIIFISLGSGFSGTCRNAEMVAEEIGDGHIFVVDSKNLSSGLGLLVLKACKLRDEGKSALEIKNEVEKCVPLVRCQFVMNTLTYMNYGGRCSGVTKIFGTLLRIKPIIKVVDNQMVLAKKPIGSYEKARKVMFQDFINDLPNIDLENVMVTHVYAHEDAKVLKQEIKLLANVKNTYETEAGTTVATHCGPRTIGVLYILNK